MVELSCASSKVSKGFCSELWSVVADYFFRQPIRSKETSVVVLRMEMTSGNFEWDTVVLRQDKEMLPLMFCEVDVRKLSGSFGHDHGCSGAAVSYTHLTLPTRSLV